MRQRESLTRVLNLVYKLRSSWVTRMKKSHIVRGPFRVVLAFGLVSLRSQGLPSRPQGDLACPLARGHRRWACKTPFLRLALFPVRALQAGEDLADASGSALQEAKRGLLASHVRRPRLVVFKKSGPRSAGRHQRWQVLEVFAFGRRGYAICKRGACANIR